MLWIMSHQFRTSPTTSRSSAATPAIPRMGADSSATAAWHSS